MLDPAIYEAIGEVAVASAALDFQTVNLVRVACDEDSEWLERALLAPGGALTALTGLIRKVEPGEFDQDLRQLRRDFRASQKARHATIHSVVAVRLDETPRPHIVPMAWHPKTGKLGEIDVEVIREQARRLQALSARSLSLASTAHEWRTAPARPEETP